MGKLVLYGLEPSPPVRACLLTLKALDLPYEFKVVDLLQGENLNAEYLAKNPQHTVPLLEDDGHCIWDSHAICAYLVRKYGKDDTLYPKEFRKRALTDQRLHFESGVVFQGALRNTTEPLFFHNVTNIPQRNIDAVVRVYEMLESFLQQQPYMAGEQLTIADFSLISTVTSLVALASIDAAKYPKLTAWIRRISKLPYYEEANGKGAAMLIDMIKAKNIKIVK